MNRECDVYYDDIICGLLKEEDGEFIFCYDDNWLKNENAKPISLTLPLSHKEYRSNILFSFFDGLIPEGWLLSVVQDKWKIESKDRMGLLLALGEDCIGAVSVKER